jgi:hypothetical protein
MLKQMKHHFSTYYAEFQHYTTNIQCNDHAKHTALMRGMNNEIKDAFALSDDVSQQFEGFVTFLQALDNRIRVREA